MVPQLTAGSDATVGALAGAVAAPADGAVTMPATAKPDAATRIRERLTRDAQPRVRTTTAARADVWWCPSSACGFAEHERLIKFMSSSFLGRDFHGNTLRCARQTNKGQVGPLPAGPKSCPHRGRRPSASSSPHPGESGFGLLSEGQSRTTRLRYSRFTAWTIGSRSLIFTII